MAPDSRYPSLGDLRAATSIAFCRVFIRLLKVRLSHRPNPSGSFALNMTVVALGPASDKRTSILNKSRRQPFFSTSRCGSMASNCQSMLATASLHAQEASSSGTSSRN